VVVVVARFLLIVCVEENLESWFKFDQIIMCLCSFPLSSNRQHCEIDGCLDENREDY